MEKNKMKNMHKDLVVKKACDFIVDGNSFYEKRKKTNLKIANDKQMSKNIRKAAKKEILKDIEFFVGNSNLCLIIVLENKSEEYQFKLDVEEYLIRHHKLNNVKFQDETITINNKSCLIVTDVDSVDFIARTVLSKNIVEVVFLNIYIHNFYGSILEKNFRRIRDLAYNKTNRSDIIAVIYRDE